MFVLPTEFLTEILIETLAELLCETEEDLHISSTSRLRTKGVPPSQIL